MSYRSFGELFLSKYVFDTFGYDMWTLNVDDFYGDPNMEKHTNVYHDFSVNVYI